MHDPDRLRTPLRRVGAKGRLDTRLGHLRRERGRRRVVEVDARRATGSARGPSQTEAEALARLAEVLRPARGAVRFVACR